jgi:hypothetical protein
MFAYQIQVHLSRLNPLVTPVWISLRGFRSESPQLFRRMIARATPVDFSHHIPAERLIYPTSPISPPLFLTYLSVSPCLSPIFRIRETVCARRCIVLAQMDRLRSRRRNPPVIWIFRLHPILSTNLKNKLNLNISEKNRIIFDSRRNSRRKIRCELISEVGENVQSISTVGRVEHCLRLWPFDPGLI